MSSNPAGTFHINLPKFKKKLSNIVTFLNYKSIKVNINVLLSTLISTFIPYHHKEAWYSTSFPSDLPLNVKYDILSHNLLSYIEKRIQAF